MTHGDVGRSNGVAKPKHSVIPLMVASCIPVLVILAVVLIIAGVNASFVGPAVVCGAMVGMLTFVSVRDRTTI